MTSRMRKSFWLLLVLPGSLFITVFMLIPLFSVVISTFFPELIPIVSKMFLTGVTRLEVL